MVQSMPDASPVKWHLAHTTWFFETFVLERYDRGFKPFQTRVPRAVQFLLQHGRRQAPAPAARPADAARTRRGARVPRPRRRAHGRAARARAPARNRPSLDLVDARHQSRAAASGADPHRREAPAVAQSARAGLSGTLAAYVRCARASSRWISIAGGSYEVGHDGDGFAFDNEGPRHTVLHRSRSSSHRTR